MARICYGRVRSGLVRLLVVLVCAAAGARAQAEPVQGSSRPVRAETQQGVQSGQGLLPVFEFHSGFWVNLHHFLYERARESAGSRSSDRDADTRSDGLPTGAAGLTPDEQRAWFAAVNYYQAQFADRDLVFNSDMVNIKNRLAELGACTEISGSSAPQCASGLRPELIDALERAAGVYRTRWWPAHDRANRQWIAQAAPMVRQFGGMLAQQLAAIYQAEWPGHVRVDVAAEANWAGAYTTLNPVHVTISSTDLNNQGLSGLEILFDEASHALAGNVSDAIVRECRSRGKAIPRDLWHALLFYTTGEIVKRAMSTGGPFAGSKGNDGTLSAYRVGLYKRGWEGYRGLLERHWQPYLDGKVDFETAVAHLVSAL